MLYSLPERAKVQQMNPGVNQSEISRILGRQWKALSPDDQEPYREEAKLLKDLHEAQYPLYSYKPIRKRRCAARKIKSSTKEANPLSTRGTTSTNRKLRTGNSLDVSDSTASKNHQVGTGVQKKRPRLSMPRIIRRVPKERVPQELLEQEPPQLIPLVPVWE